MRSLIFAIVVACVPCFAFATGEERTTVSDDLVIRTDTRWTGGNEGGYLPVRVQVINHGPPQNLLFEISPTANETQAPTVRRLVGMEQNATVRFTLSVPLVGFNNGTLRVLGGRGELKSHMRTISIASSAYNSVQAPASMLVISSSTVDCKPFIELAELSQSTGGARAWGGGSVFGPAVADVVPPTQLPDSWIDYSSVDIVAISREELAALERQARTALLKWVQCGGNLVVYSVGKGPEALRQLEKLTEISEHAAVSGNWQQADPEVRQRLTLPKPTEQSTPWMPRPPAKATATTSKIPGMIADLAATLASSKGDWPGSKDTFLRRELMFGMVFAFPEDPFPGKQRDWAWLLSTMGTDRQSWTLRHGMSTRIGTQDFFTFMNPGIHGVPTVAFMILITLFAIAIGPVNYFMLARRKMLWMLLVTVPIFAMVTSLLLVGYSVAAHGFAVRSRIRSLTMIDQKSRSAVTMARLALFAGMAPSGGLRFSPDTAVFPVFPTMNEPNATTVDWTERQNLATGWLPARARTQFFTMNNAEQRSRVDIKPAGDGKIELSNGLPWDLEAVVVSDDSGKMFIGRNVAANASAVLSTSNVEDTKVVAALLSRNHPELPPGFVAPSPGPFSGRRWMYYWMGHGTSTHFDTNLMERKIAELQRAIHENRGFAPRSYLAVLRENPGVETGVPVTTEQLSYHLVLGYY